MELPEGANTMAPRGPLHPFGAFLLSADEIFLKLEFIHTKQINKEVRNMSKSKIVAIMALIGFAMGIFLVGNALAGEKFKGRTVYYTTKWEQITAPGEDKHLLAIIESKGISSNTEGKPFFDGTVEVYGGLCEMDLKNVTGSIHGYEESTDRDGNKIYYRFEGSFLKGKFWGSYWEGKSTILRGTGKYEGIKGEAKWSSYAIAPMQSFSDWEFDVELPR
jgi:hypothetical protein